MVYPKLYKKTYFTLISEKNLDQIKNIIKDHEYFDPDAIDTLEIREREGIPFLYLFVETADYLGDGHYGMVDGIYVQIESIVPEWREIFYLPVLIMRKMVNKKLKQLIDTEELYNHEFFHIKEMIDFIDENPSYIHESMVYGAGNCTLTDLEKSIGFEIRKIFTTEVNALAHDFDNGARDFLSYEKGTISKVILDDKEQYLRFQLSNSITNLYASYKERFPEEEKNAMEIMKKEINKQGKDVYGDDASLQFGFTLLATFTILKNDAICTTFSVGEV